MFLETGFGLFQIYKINTYETVKKSNIKLVADLD